MTSPSSTPARAAPAARAKSAEPLDSLSSTTAPAATYKPQAAIQAAIKNAATEVNSPKGYVVRGDPQKIATLANENLARDFHDGKTDKLIQLRPDAWGNLRPQEVLSYRDIKTDPDTGKPVLRRNGSPELITVYPDIERAQKAVQLDLDRLATRYPPAASEASVSVTVRTNYRNVEEYLAKDNSSRPALEAGSVLADLLESGNRPLVGRKDPNIPTALNSSRELYHDVQAYLALRSEVRESTPEDGLATLGKKILGEMKNLSTANKVALCEDLRKNAAAKEKSSPDLAKRLRDEFLAPLEKSVQVQTAATGETYLQTLQRHQANQFARAYRENHTDSKVPPLTSELEGQPFLKNHELFSQFTKAGGDIQKLPPEFKAQLLAANPDKLHDDWLTKVRALADTKDQKARDLVNAYELACKQAQAENKVIVAAKDPSAAAERLKDSIKELIEAKGEKGLASLLYQCQKNGESKTLKTVWKALDIEQQNTLQTMVQEKIKELESDLTKNGGAIKVLKELDYTIKTTETSSA